MASASLQGKTVRELQELARQTPQPRKRRKPGLSRAAHLHLIDILSRWSGLGLALVAGVSIYMAVVAGRAFPVRAAAWAAMMLGSLWIARRLRSDFRNASSPLSSHPFRWRASFTASLSVLGVVLASAPILLSPADAASVFGVQILALSVTGCFAAALLAAAHLSSAAAFAAPGAIFAVLTGIRAGDSGLIIASLATSVLGLTGLYLAHRYLEKSAARAYPRTQLVRREVLRQTGAGGESARPQPSALQA